MPRIAIVTDWFAPRRGGIESQLHELAAHLASLGHDVDVITPAPGASSHVPYGVRRLDVWRLPSPPLAVSPALLGKLRRELDAGYDIVHAHVSVVSPAAWAGAFVARGLGLPTAVTFHSVLRAKALALRALSAVSPIATARVAWSAVSQFVASQAQRALGDAADVRVLPNGIDPEWWGRGTGGERDDAITFMSTMRLHRKKRPLALLRAFSDAVRFTRKRARLVLIGDGPERGRIQRALRALDVGGGAEIRLRGWLAPEEVRAAYSGADAFVMPSVHESFGIAALEAAAAGLPVIARRSGVAEFVVDGDNGILADSDAELAAAIRSLIDDDALRARLRPRPAAFTRFDWQAVTTAHLAEYDRAIRLAATPARAVAASA